MTYSPSPALRVGRRSLGSSLLNNPKKPETPFSLACERHAALGKATIQKESSPWLSGDSFDADADADDADDDDDDVDADADADDDDGHGDDGGDDDGGDDDDAW